MTPEEKQERLKQAEGFQRSWREMLNIIRAEQFPRELQEAAGHIDFLLSLVKEQEVALAEEVAWRREHDAKMIESMAAQGRWIESLQGQLNDVATSMRSACVEKVKAIRDTWAAKLENAEEFSAVETVMSSRVYGADVIIKELESLSIEKDSTTGEL